MENRCNRREAEHAEEDAETKHQGILFSRRISLRLGVSVLNNSGQIISLPP